MTSEQWKTGGWVRDTEGQIWVRSSDEDAAQGWAWRNPPPTPERVIGGQTFIVVPSGAVPEDHPTRPLTRIVRASAMREDRSRSSNRTGPTSTATTR
ncbi:hypothetical protein LO763_19800 [Glycomyces sp. A-F 0318]|uniref:hypothetical protein n=1 Tax=Glycomyces amatae TaxID=2881355 RepID=UPI001E37CD14|nr:hypothetical protein [Glycomyces amatae]MCD0445857.1 hypothetical protein [Glycomyces amatae]